MLVQVCAASKSSYFMTSRSIVPVVPDNEMGQAMYVLNIYCMVCSFYTSSGTVYAMLTFLAALVHHI